MENDLNLTNRPNNNHINDIATSVSVENMVRFGKKESAERRQLLASMNSMHYNSAKQIDNGEFKTFLSRFSNDLENRLNLEQCASYPCAGVHIFFLLSEIFETIKSNITVLLSAKKQYLSVIPISAY